MLHVERHAGIVRGLVHCCLTAHVIALLWTHGHREHGKWGMSDFVIFGQPNVYGISGLKNLKRRSNDK
jgi:hypothetical protein